MGINTTEREPAPYITNAAMVQSTQWKSSIIFIALDLGLDEAQYLLALEDLMD